MDITLNLIRDVLEPFGVDFSLCRSRANAAFRMLSWLPEEGLGEPDESLLYVLADAEGFDRAAALDERHYMLTQGGDGAETLRCNVIRVDPKADFVAACNALNRCNRRLMDWELTAERALLGKCDLQRLLDISEPMLRNPALIMSKSLRLIAYTKNIPMHDEILQKTIETSSFPKELIAYLIKKDHLSAIEGMRETGITRAEDNFVKCPIITRAFGPNPLNINTVSVYCLNSEPTPGEVDIVNYLSELVYRLASLHDEKAPEGDRKAEYLLLDVLGRKLDEDEIEIRAELTRMPFRGALRMYCLRSKSGEGTLSGYLLSVLQSQYHVAAALQYEGMLVFLDNEGLRGDEGVEEFKDWLSDFLSDKETICGISRIFDRLSDAPAAFEQARAAISLGSLLNPGERLHSYMDYYIYDLVASSNRGLEAMCVFRRELEAIEERDKKRGSDNLELLHSLLRNERNITKVSKEMHLHRNSVLYRMERIEEYLGMKLDDPVKRLALEISIRALHLMRVGLT